jgi:8-hydroxy-5-deazaflavin:NADPH oxidoreductase
VRVAIFGAGHIGGTLERRLTELGHDVAVANSRGPEGIARDADLVVLAVPLKAVPDLPAGDIGSTPVVDANNYYPGRDGRIDAIEGGTPSSRWVADALGGATVVKAFNTMQWQHLGESGRAPGEPDRLAIPLYGDDEAAKATVGGLVDALGFDAVDGGPLDESWRQEPGTPAYGADLGADQTRSALAAAER